MFLSYVSGLLANIVVCIEVGLCRWFVSCRFVVFAVVVVVVVYVDLFYNGCCRILVFAVHSIFNATFMNLQFCSTLQNMFASAGG